MFSINTRSTIELSTLHRMTTSACKLVALIAKITIGKNSLKYKHSSLFQHNINVEEKSVRTKIPVVSVVKMFFPTVMLWLNKLERLSFAGTHSQF
jgi:hypothetical protein